MHVVILVGGDSTVVGVVTILYLDMVMGSNESEMSYMLLL